MKKSVFYILLLWTISCQSSTAAKSPDWVALEEEACSLGQSSADFDHFLFPDKDLQNKDPETKMPESGIFHTNSRNTIVKFPEKNGLTPYVSGINGYSGFTNLANAP